MKREKHQKQERVSVASLLQLLPNNYLEELAKELLVDKWVRKLPGSALFKLVLFSLRTMEDNCGDLLFRVMASVLTADVVTWGRHSPASASGLSG